VFVIAEPWMILEYLEPCLSASEPAVHEKVRNCSTRSSFASLEE
jgi:hypothetical protein